MSWSYNHLLAVEVSEIGATLIALSVPGIKPLVDRYVLHKDGSTQFGGSKYKRETISQASKATALSTLKLRSEYSMLGNDNCGRYGTKVSGGAGSTYGGGGGSDDAAREGIQVTVDVRVKNEGDDLAENRKTVV